MKQIKIKDFFISEEKLTFICGPCVIEDEKFTFDVAEKLKSIFSDFNFNFIFKASFDKANRSSINSFRGPGIEKGLNILKKIKDNLDLCITSDIHLPNQAEIAKEVLDLIQIPAFLCRQTDLLIAAGKTHLPVNVKKGQFMSPWDMKNVVDKIKSTGNENILLTDRGTFFGYNNLISDFRAILVMKSFGFPICFDASHSTQLPGGNISYSSGQKEFIPPLAKAAVVVGANVIFIECHPNPNKAKSDSATVLALEDLKKLLKEIEIIHQALTPQKVC